MAAAISAGGWLAFSVAAGVQGFLSDLMSGETTLRSLPSWLGWQSPRWTPFIVLTPIIIWLGDRFPFGSGRIGRALLVHVPASILGAVLHTALAAKLYQWVYPETVGTWAYSTAFLSQFESFLAQTILIYWAILGVWHAFSFYRRLQEEALQAARLETQLARARHEALEAQLQPHFMFNTLHAIGVLVDRDPGSASRMIRHLGDLLRASLGNSESYEIPLRKELDFVEAYLEIEKERFRDRLTIEWDIDDSLGGTPVPNLLLQPLVENAIKHGVSKHRGPAQVRIATLRENGSALLVVEDQRAVREGAPAYPTGTVSDGPEGTGDGEEGEEGILGDPAQIRHGIGLRAVRDRLESHYGPDASLELRSTPRGMKAVATVPLLDP